MRKPLSGLLCILLILAITTISWKSAKINKHSIDFKSGFTARGLLEKYISNIYESAHLQESGLELEVFEKAVTGFMDLKASNKLPQTSSILTVVDLTKSSHEKRMWIIDMIDNELLVNTWVSHGHCSGDDMATSFSNRIDSHQSSLGFYITDDVYYGNNGRSLRLDGMDEGFNSNARKRAIVLHGADYVGEHAIGQLGRLGRSYGCPAVPIDMSDKVIDLIKNKTVIFINGNDNRYTSKFLDQELAASYVFPETSHTVLASM
jgi:hypothetical protein